MTNIDSDSNLEGTSGAGSQYRCLPQPVHTLPHERTDGRTDGQTDRQTDGQSLIELRVRNFKWSKQFEQFEEEKGERRRRRRKIRTWKKMYVRSFS